MTSEALKALADDQKFILVDDEVIKDKAKADVLAKSLSVLQVARLFVECIARKGASYPLTLVEIHTLVHVFCAIVTYAFWAEKPLDVGQPIPVDAALFGGDTMTKFHELAERADRAKNAHSEEPRPKEPLIKYANNFNALHDYLDTITSLDLLDKAERTKPRPARTAWWRVKHHLAPRLTMVLISIAYGGLHLSAWNFDFPTWGERLGWIISCLIVLFGPTAGLLTAYLVTQFKAWLHLEHDEKWHEVYKQSWRYAQWGHVAMVLLCRSFLIIESFVSLRRVPLGVYEEVPWTRYIPSF